MFYTIKVTVSNYDILVQCHYHHQCVFTFCDDNTYLSIYYLPSALLHVSLLMWDHPNCMMSLMLNLCSSIECNIQQLLYYLLRYTHQCCFCFCKLFQKRKSPLHASTSITHFHDIIVASNFKAKFSIFLRVLYLNN